MKKFPAVFLLIIGFCPLHPIGEGVIISEAGLAFRSLAQISEFAAGISWWIAPDFGKECHFLSRLCDDIARYCYAKGGINAGSSLESWKAYQQALSEMPASSKEEKKLLSFLGKRWLAKANGFFSAEVDWLCPLFGYSMQVHPETTNSYARDPSSRATATYLNRAQAWKKQLTQPADFPLILTRPCDVKSFLPETVQGRPFIDLTDDLKGENREEWLRKWEICKKSLPEDAVCVQRIKGEAIGGLRVLPLSEKKSESDYRFLLEWVSHMGLAANPIELDRVTSAPPWNQALARSFDSIAKQQFLLFLESFEREWKTKREEKELMVKGALAVLKGFFCGDTGREVG